MVASAGQENEIAVPSPSDHGFWRSVAITAAIAIGNLMREHCLHWGTDRFPVIVLQPIALALLTLLEDLMSDSNLSVFATLCIVTRSVATRFRVARGILSLASKMAKHRRVMLPLEVEQLLKVDQADVPSELRGPQVDDIGVDYLLAKWVDLEM